MEQKPVIHTIGHSTHSLSDFIDILHGEGVNFLVDVRTIPRSRTNPQFNKDTLPDSLAQEGIAYRHIAELGGLRSRTKAAEASPNNFWDNASFRNYADYAMSPEFRRGLSALKDLAAQNRCAIMCAEAVWWRCHRRIIADYLMADHYPVMNIMGSQKTEPAHMTDAAHIQNDLTIIYPARQTQLFAFER